MVLSDKIVREIEPTRSRQMISDHTGGLVLSVQAGGSHGAAGAKTFLWRGRIGDKVRKITIGRAESMKVKDARLKAFEISQAVREGRDPHAETKAAVATQKTVKAKAMTVDEAWSLYMQREGCLRKTAIQKENIYKREVKPVIGSKRMTDVESDDLAKIVNQIGQRAPVQGDRVQSLLSRFFRWSSSSKARSETGLKDNPMGGVEKPHGKANHRERFLSVREIKWFMQAVREIQAEGSNFGGISNPNRTRRNPKMVVAQWAIGLEILLRTGQRKMDILNLTDSEIDFEACTAVIPPDRHKSGKAHLVWLSPQVQTLLQSVHRPDAGSKRSNAGLIFQRLGNCDHQVNKIRERMEKIAGQKIEHWTIHDLRRTMASTMMDMVDEDERPYATTDEIKKVLGHTLSGAIAAYLHGQSIPLKRRIGRVWNDYLDNITGQDV